jgi:hypothetical protein
MHHKARRILILSARWRSPRLDEITAVSAGTCAGQRVAVAVGDIPTHLLPLFAAVCLVSGSGTALGLMAVQLGGFREDVDAALALGAGDMGGDRSTRVAGAATAGHE